MEEKKRASKAHMKATEKWEKINYDRILIRFPKGTKEQIVKTGLSINGYVVQAVQKKLKEDGIIDKGIGKLTMGQKISDSQNAKAKDNPVFPFEDRNIPFGKWAKTIKDIGGNRCAVCGNTLNLESHHIIPRAEDKQKESNINNGICLCRQCHRRIHSLSSRGIDYSNVRMITGKYDKALRVIDRYKRIAQRNKKYIGSMVDSLDEETLNELRSLGIIN